MPAFDAPDRLYPDAVAILAELPAIVLARYPTPLEDLSRLRAALGGGPRLLIKRDDAISFAFGGNKVRKLEMVAALALAEGADTLVTAGGVQSNHARVTAAVAARLGLKCVLVVNGAEPADAEKRTANALLDALVGAEIAYVGSRQERAPAMRAACERLRREGRKPFEIPIGASIATGALGYVRAVGELVRQVSTLDAIVHSTSSGGTQAGLVAGCEIFGIPARVIGISADDAAADIARDVREIIKGIGAIVGIDGDRLAAARPIEIDDSFVGEGYGIPTVASREALELTARTEAIFLDPTYTAKAMAGLIDYVRRGRFHGSHTVLFWHTGGQVALFA